MKSNLKMRDPGGKRGRQTQQEKKIISENTMFCHTKLKRFLSAATAQAVKYTMQKIKKLFVRTVIAATGDDH